MLQLKKLKYEWNCRFSDQSQTFKISHDQRMTRRYVKTAPNTLYSLCKVCFVTHAIYSAKLDSMKTPVLMYCDSLAEFGVTKGRFETQ